MGSLPTCLQTRQQPLPNSKYLSGLLRAKSISIPYNNITVSNSDTTVSNTDITITNTDITVDNSEITINNTDIPYNNNDFSIVGLKLISQFFNDITIRNTDIRVPILFWQTLILEFL